VTHGRRPPAARIRPGFSDYIVMVRGRPVRLGRAALLKAATGEIHREELGGAEMHTSISGLGDYLAEDDRDALRIARDIMANLEWDRPRAIDASLSPAAYNAESCSASCQ